MGNGFCSRNTTKNKEVDLDKLSDYNYNKEINKVIKIQSFYRKFKCREKYLDMITINPNTATKNSPVIKEEITPEKAIKTTSIKSKKKKLKIKKKKSKNENCQNDSNDTPFPNNPSKQDDNNNKENNKTDKNNTLLNDFLTPENDFSEDMRPGEIIENFDEIPITPQVKKIENSLGEYLIEEKELLKYIESYPYKLKHYQLEYINNDKYNGYFGPEWKREGFGI